MSNFIHHDNCELYHHDNEPLQYDYHTIDIIAHCITTRNYSKIGVNGHMIAFGSSHGCQVTKCTDLAGL